MNISKFTNLVIVTFSIFFGGNIGCKSKEEQRAVKPSETNVTLSYRVRSSKSELYFNSSEINHMLERGQINQLLEGLSNKSVQERGMIIDGKKVRVNEVYYSCIINQLKLFKEFPHLNFEGLETSRDEHIEGLKSFLKREQFDRKK